MAARSQDRPSPNACATTDLTPPRRGCLCADRWHWPVFWSHTCIPGAAAMVPSSNPEVIDRSAHGICQLISPLPPSPHGATSSRKASDADQR